MRVSVPLPRSATLNHTRRRLHRPAHPRAVDENYAPDAVDLLALATDLMSFEGQTSIAMLDLCRVVRNKLLHGRVG